MLVNEKMESYIGKTDSVVLKPLVVTIPVGQPAKEAGKSCTRWPHVR
jgi:hypothetical protein